MPAEDLKGWIVAFLATGGLKRRYNEPVAGRTRLVKEMFLFGKVYEPERFFAFAPDKYGPNSMQLLRLLDTMTREGTVQIGPEFGGTYSLTPHGLTGYDGIARGLTQREIDGMAAIKRRWNLAPMPSLLHHVYTSYPQYTARSEIRDRVLGEGT